MGHLCLMERTLNWPEPSPHWRHYTIALNVDWFIDTYLQPRPLTNHISPAPQHLAKTSPCFLAFCSQGTSDSGVSLIPRSRYLYRAAEINLAAVIASLKTGQTWWFIPPLRPEVFGRGGERQVAAGVFVGKALIGRFTPTFVPLPNACLVLLPMPRGRGCPDQLPNLERAHTKFS